MTLTQRCRSGLLRSRRAESQLQAYTTKRRAVEADINRAQDLIIQLGKERIAINNQMQSKKGGDPQTYNRLVAQANERGTDIDEGNKYVEQRKADLEKLTEPGDHITVTLDLADRMDAAAKQYEQLADDEQVKAALSQINQTSKIKFRLGSSPTFADQLPRLRSTRHAEQCRCQTRIPRRSSSCSGDAQWSGACPNGLRFRASLVTITSGIAKELNLATKADDEEITLVVADGKEVKAKVATLASLQVGQFNVKNVSMRRTSRVGTGGFILPAWGYVFGKTLSIRWISLRVFSHLSAISADAAIATSQPTMGESQAKITQPNSTKKPTMSIVITAEIDGTDELKVNSEGIHPDPQASKLAQPDQDKWHSLESESRADTRSE